MPYSYEDTFPSFLELKTSTIPNAGRGVFTKLDLPAGLSFGPYTVSNFFMCHRIDKYVLPISNILL